MFILKRITDFLNDVSQEFSYAQRGKYYEREFEINRRIEERQRHVEQVIADKQLYEQLIVKKAQKRGLIRLTNDALKVYLGSKEMQNKIFNNLSKIEEYKKQLYFKQKGIRNIKIKDEINNKIKSLKAASIILRKDFNKQRDVKNRNYKTYKAVKNKKDQLTAEIKEGYEILNTHKEQRLMLGY
jgi:hypothetical protein